MLRGNAEQLRSGATSLRTKGILHQKAKSNSMGRAITRHSGMCGVRQLALNGNLHAPRASETVFLAEQQHEMSAFVTIWSKSLSYAMMLETRILVLPESETAAAS
eukprot:2633381-Pleurochrysis_carterae.AAC.5